MATLGIKQLLFHYRVWDLTLTRLIQVINAAIVSSLDMNISSDAVHFSNHPAYSGGFKGSTLSAVEFKSLCDGLISNRLLNYEAILSGYVRSEDVLNEISVIVRRIKSENENAIYVCDPVLGDNGNFYVPGEGSICGHYLFTRIKFIYTAKLNYMTNMP